MNSLNLIQLHCIGVILVVAGWCGAQIPTPSDGTSSLRVYIGTDTGPTKGQGIYLTNLNMASGALSEPQLAVKVSNPTFLALHPSHKFLFAANGVQRFKGKREGSASGFLIDDATGKLTLINQQPSGAPGPCHLSIGRDGKFVLIANYSGGGFEAIPVNDRGEMGNPSSVVLDDKSDPKRQPHGHCIQFDPTGRFVVGDDLGLDRIFVFRFDAEKGTLTANDPPAVETPHGTGPRHLAFHPNGKWAYNIDELNSTMIAYSWDSDKGVFTELQTLSTLPADFHGKSACAEVLVSASGRFLYGTNRGHDSIVIFKIDGETGKLTPISYVPTGGKTPRSFTFDPSGKWLVVSNQDSGTIVVFKVDSETGGLQPSGEPVHVPVPTCVMFAPR